MFLSFALFFSSLPLFLLFPNLCPIFFSSPLFYFLIPLHSSPFTHTSSDLLPTFSISSSPILLHSPSISIHPSILLCRHWPVLQLHGGVQGPGPFRPLLDAVLRAVRRAPRAGLPQQPARARHGRHAARHWGTLLYQPLRPTHRDFVRRLVQR